ncbi:MAG: UdgX family uracil-DNA binding protein [Nitrospirae bacterium]|nr:UdgX family uracil-DNA binding protein [Candidatus Manganitrophaceae bacterium]
MTAARLIPPNPTLAILREAAAGCQACDLWKSGTQTVFGEGPEQAAVMLVGEQPGDKEDQAGRPFVGPAGGLLNGALEEAGIVRDEVYVTNAVKHFKWEPRGKRRIHKKPNAAEITACRPWLEAEIKLIQPKIIVCLGATAAQALLGKDFRVTRQRGELLPSPFGGQILATVHPSSLLRIEDEAERREARARFVEDLKQVAKALHRLRPAA